MYIVYCISYLFSGYHWVTPLPYFSPVLPSRWSCRSSCSSATSSFVFFLHYLLSVNLQPRDHCGLWRLLVATIGITGVVVVARPPGIFPPEVSLTLEIVFGLCQFLLSAQVRINALTVDNSGFHLMESAPPEQDFTGVLWALAVPLLTSTINIITRQVEWICEGFS